MAFIKNKNAANAPISTDLRNIFIGRAKELVFFAREILQPEDPAYNIISIWGNAGVGKSTLLTKFIDIASSPEFKDYCLTAQADERQATPTSIMEKFADQLRIAGYPLVDFEKALDTYKNSLRNLRTRQDTQRAIFSQSNIFEPASFVFKDNLNLRGNLREKISSIAQNFEIGYLSRQLFKDFERIEDPIGELTTTFINELNRLADTTVAQSLQQTKHQRRVVLFFDTFEQLALDTVPWLLNYFLEANISSNVILVVAGRVVIERSIQSYQRDWQKHKSTIYPIFLDSFSEDETRDYLTAQGTTEPKRISTLLQLSRGLPYSLSLLTSNTQGEVDLTKDVVDNYLRGIPEHEEIKRRLALEAALLTRPFNQDDLKAFVYLTENDWPILYRWLSEQPFVRSNPQDGRHSYHDLARETFTRHLYQISPTQYQSTRKALADHYQFLLEKIEKEAGKSIYKVPEWLELVIALAHQLFLLPDEESHIRAIEQILEAYRYSSKEQDSEVIRFLREILQNQPTNMASVDARQIAKFLIQYIETSSEKKRVQEFLAATSFLIEKLKKASSTLSLLARIYCDRGDSYLSLKKYQQALADYNQAVEHNTSLIRAYSSRAKVYNQLESYEDALLELNRALEIEPDNEFVLLNRGSIYESMKRYEEALRNFERIIELELKLKPIAFSQKGIVLYKMGRYKEAAESLTEAVRAESTLQLTWIWLARAYQALHPYQEIPGLLKALSVPKANSASVITNRALAMRDTGYYEETIVEATRAIELEPQYARAIVQRGLAYFYLGSFEEAVNDLSLALTLKPNDPEALFYRGQAYNFMKHYTDALHDFNAILGHNSPNDSIVFFCRSRTYRYMGQYKEALRDLDHAIELDRDFKHPVEEQRGEVLKESGKKEEACTAFLEALKAKATCSDCWINLAEVYGDVYSRREIPRRLREVTVLDENNPSVIACRAQAMKHMRHEEEAIVELAGAFELDPDNELALRVRSGVYIHWDRFEEALRDLDLLAERTRDLKHWKQEKRGEVLQQLGRNQEALTAFLEAVKTNATCNDCWISLAVTYEILEGRSETAKWLRELSISNLDENANLMYRAKALNATRHYEEAIITFTEALKLKPKDAKSMISRGQVYDELRLYDKALADFTEALKLKPNDPDAILSRGRTYAHKNQYREALKDFDLAIGLDRDFEHEGQKEKGLVLYSLQRYQEAITAFTQALKIEPTSDECWMGLARTYEASFSRSQLPKLMQAIPISTTDKAFVIAVRAEVMRKLGYYQEALTDLDHALALDETLISRFIDSRGLLLSYLERYEEAIESHKQQLKYSPNYYGSLYNLAVAMTCWKGELDAKKHIDAALEALLAKVPTVHCGAALYGLGGLAALRGETTQALDYLKAALSFEKESITWAQHDIAWHNLRSDTRFQNLILNGQQENRNPLAFDWLEREGQQRGMKSDTPTPGSVHTLISLESQTLLTLKVFLCYSPDDKLVVQELYRRLQADGIDPWLDEENLLPGQEKEVEIRKAVRYSDVVIVCLSPSAIQRAGRTHQQIAYALDIAEEQPEGTIFLIPLQLENCTIPDRLSRWQSVNLFDEHGYERLIDALRTKFPRFNTDTIS